ERAARVLVVQDLLGHGSGLDDREDVARAEDQELLVAVLELGAAVLGEDDLVADLDVHGDTLALVVEATGADGDDLALLGLLLRGVRDDQAGGGGLLRLERLDDDAVLEGLDGDRHAAHSFMKRLTLYEFGVGSRVRSSSRCRPGRVPRSSFWHSLPSTANGTHFRTRAGPHARRVLNLGRASARRVALRASPQATRQEKATRVHAVP